MPDDLSQKPFSVLNRAFNRVFQPGRLSLGLVVPLQSYRTSAVPDMHGDIERAVLADQLGYAALWLRDVPFNVPSFGDAGQIYDPFVYLGLLAGATKDIGLGVASIILPLRHPAHVAKAAASVDVLSGGRMLLGVASGDRPEEFPAMGQGFEDRGARFRESLDYIRAAADDMPQYSGSHGTLPGHIDMIPKPTAGQLPILITGGSQQAPDWVAAHGDGWMTYPRDVALQGRVVADYRSRVQAAGQTDKPVMQSLYVDLLNDVDATPCPIHLGFQSGVGFLKRYLKNLEAHGVNHVALNLRFNAADNDDTIRRLADELLPEFNA